MTVKRLIASICPRLFSEFRQNAKALRVAVSPRQEEQLRKALFFFLQTKGSSVKIRLRWRI